MTALKACKNGRQLDVCLNRMLLAGEPGIGKTALIVDMAHALQIEYLIIKASSFYDSTAGNIELKIQALTSLIMGRKENEPLLILFDELDGAAASRTSDKNGEITRTITTALCSLLSETEKIKQVCLVATTNHRDHVDEAIISRFNKGLINLEKMKEKKDFMRFFMKSLKDNKYSDSPETLATAEFIYECVNKASQKRNWFGEWPIIGPVSYPGRDLYSIVENSEGFTYTEANLRSEILYKKGQLDRKLIKKAVDDMDKAYRLQMWNKKMNEYKAFGKNWGPSIGIVVAALSGAYFGLDKLGYFDKAKTAVETAGTTVTVVKETSKAALAATALVSFGAGAAANKIMSDKSGSGEQKPNTKD